MSGWRLLLTRPTDDSARLAEILSAQGIVSASLPLLEIEPLPETAQQRATILELDRYALVIVVSKPAARLGTALIDRFWPQPPARQQWFCVGPATAALLNDYLNDHGLVARFPAQGDDSEALLAMPEFRQAVQQENCRALILRGDTGRDYLAERLRDQGVGVDYLPLYRRRLPAYSEGELPALIEREGLNGLVISSGQGLQNLLTLADWDWPRLARLPLFVPSTRVAGLARKAGAQDVVDCHGASAAALLAALQRYPGNAPDTRRMDT